MPTHLAIAPELLDRAFALSGEKTKKAAVTSALKEFIARREQQATTFERLKAELTSAFAAPEASYQPLTAADVIARNRK